MLVLSCVQINDMHVIISYHDTSVIYTVVHVLAGWFDWKLCVAFHVCVCILVSTKISTAMYR